MRFLFIILSLISFLGEAQNMEKVNEKLEKRWSGNIRFNNGDEMTCDFAYNPLAPEGLLFVKNDSTTQVFGVSKVRSFNFYDQELKRQRYFYAIAAHSELSGEPIGKYFFEEIYPNKEISIIGRVAVKSKVSRNSYSDITKVKIYDHYKKYLLEHKSNILYELSMKRVLKLTADRKDEIHKFIKEKKLWFSDDDLSGYYALVDYYSAIKTNP